MHLRTVDRHRVIYLGGVITVVSQRCAHLGRVTENYCIPDLSAALPLMFVPDHDVQHPARLSVHGRVARPDRPPGRPRTDGVVPPDAPYRTTGHGRAAESRIDRHPVSIGSGITTVTVRGVFPRGDGMDV